jgi:hypothetical protein
MSLSRESLQALVESTKAQNTVLLSILSELSEDRDRWCDTGMAERETGIPSARIRYLARQGHIASRKRGVRLIEVRLSDLDSYR